MFDTKTIFTATLSGRVRYGGTSFLLVICASNQRCMNMVVMKAGSENNEGQAAF